MARFDTYRRRKFIEIARQKFSVQASVLNYIDKQAVELEVDRVCKIPLDFLGKPITIGSEIVYIAGSRSCYLQKGLVTDIDVQKGIQIERQQNGKIRLGDPDKIIVIN